MSMGFFLMKLELSLELPAISRQKRRQVYVISLLPEQTHYYRSNIHNVSILTAPPIDSIIGRN